MQCKNLAKKFNWGQIPINLLMIQSLNNKGHIKLDSKHLNKYVRKQAI